MQIDKYLENISDEALCDEYLKYDRIYDDIREPKNSIIQNQPSQFF